MKEVKNVNLQALQLYIAVVEEGSFTKAAERCFVTQPYLSQLVKQLEKEYDVQLLNRSTRTLSVTDAGKVVYEQARKIVHCMEQTKVLLEQVKDVHRGEVTIAIPPLVGTIVLPQLSKHFRERYPNVKMNLIELGAKKIPDLIKNEDADIGFCVMPVDDDSLKTTSYVSSDFVVFISSDHRFANKNQVTMKQLKRESFILFSEGFTLHDSVIAHCHRHGFAPNISFETSQWDLMVELIALKMGIALLPKSIAKMMHHEHVTVLPLSEDAKFQWEIGMVTKQKKTPSFAAKAFEDVAQSLIPRHLTS